MKEKFNSNSKIIIYMSIGAFLIFSYKSLLNPGEYDYQKRINEQREIKRINRAGEGVLTHEGKSYIKFKNTLRPYNVYNNGEMRTVANMLKQGCKNDYCIAKKGLDYIKKIKYEAGNIEAKRPEEVLLSGLGDCDERSFLLASLLIEQEIEAIVIYTKNHTFIGIKCNIEGNYKSNIQINGEKFYIAETTDINAEIGKSNGIRSNEIEMIYNANKNKIIPLEEAKMNL